MFLKNLRESKHFIKKLGNLIITKVDKGNVTVVMDKIDYHSKMLNLLNDSSIYIYIQKTVKRYDTAQNKLNAWN